MRPLKQPAERNSDNAPDMQLNKKNSVAVSSESFPQVICRASHRIIADAVVIIVIIIARQSDADVKV